MNEGYIIVQRNMLNWGWYKDLNTAHLFLHCLLKANWAPGVFWGQRIGRGQFATSLQVLSTETGLSIQQVRTALKHLTMTGELTDEVKGKYRLITVSDYDRYQRVNSDPTAYHQFGSMDPTPIEKEDESIKLLSVSSSKDSDTDRQYELPDGTSCGTASGTDPAGNGIPMDDCLITDQNVRGASVDFRSRTLDIQKVVDAWNSLSSVGIHGVSKLSPRSKRYQTLVARLNEHGLDTVLAAIEKVRESDFLRGVNKNGWVITFDWFVLPSNFIKVLDGNYANRSAMASIGSLDISWLEKR